MNPNLKSTDRAHVKRLFISPSTSMDADGDRFSANNLHRAKIISNEARFPGSGSGLVTVSTADHSPSTRVTRGFCDCIS